ncbi:MAG: hypothetical protein HY000_14620 [Planctomycetes bacterium]|nr:hypothetical protein [Planctomycetota bacterium]
MPDSVVAEIICEQCGEPVAAGAASCARCGSSTGIGPGRPAESVSRGEARTAWYDNRIVVLCLLWAAMGPLALPILWYSRAFSPLSKLVQTVLMACLTAFIAWGLWYSWTVTLPMLRDLWRG